MRKTPKLTRRIPLRFWVMRFTKKNKRLAGGESNQWKRSLQAKDTTLTSCKAKAQQVGREESEREKERLRDLRDKSGDAPFPL